MVICSRGLERARHEGGRFYADMVWELKQVHLFEDQYRLANDLG